MLFGPFTSPWLTVLLALFAALAIWRASPRAHGGVRLQAVAGTLVALCFLSYANAYFAYVPDPSQLAGPSSTLRVDALPAVHVRSRGALLRLPVPGLHSGAGRHDALVYLPPQYFAEPARRFPVLYLLHGSPGTPVDWFRGGQAADAGYRAALAGHPVVLVAPRMSRTWLDDSECVDTPRFRAEQYLLEDVVPRVDLELRTVPSSGARGLSGNSAGGYCALDLALRHPDVFGAVAALSPVTRPTYAYGSTAALFGHPPDLSAVVAAHSPELLLEHSAAARQVRLRLDVGLQDPLRPQVEQLAAVARAVDTVPPLVTERTGGHTYRVWRPALRDVVAWFGAVALPQV